MNGALLLLTSWFGCGVSSDGTVQLPEPGPGPGLLLLTLEDAPATRFTPWGGSDDRLQAFADLGTTWTRAYAPTPMLQANLATLWTVRTPDQHGVWLDGMQRLPQQEVTLFEALRDAGWHTTSSTGSLLTDERWGLHQGAISVSVHDDPNPADLPAEAVVQRLVLVDEPQAAWVHLSAEQLDVVPDLVERWVDLHPEGWIVVAGVHGAGDGLELDDDALRLPLVAVGPGFDAKATIDDVVSLADVMPTVRASLGLPSERPTLLLGGSRVVDHASHLGRALFGSAVVTATTEAEGRIVVSDAPRWYGAVGTRIPTAGHIVPDDHAAVVRHKERRAAVPHNLAPPALLPLAERTRLAQVAPRVLGDPDAAGPAVASRTRSRTPFVDEVAKPLGLKRFREVHRIAEQLEGTPVGHLLHAIAYRGQADAAQAGVALEAGHASATGPVFAWHRAEIALDRCRVDTAAFWLELVVASSPLPPRDIASALHRARARGPLPPELQAEADALIAAWPDDPYVQPLADPLAITMLPVRPGSPVTGLLRARADWTQGHATEAIEALRDAVALDPMDCSMRVELARWYLEADERVAANRLLAPLVRASPDDPVLRELWERSEVSPEERREQAVDRTWNRP
jgi:hypothetical protein